MKKIILLLTLFFSVFVLSQNTDKQTIEKDMSVMMSSFNSKNYDAILDLTHPKMFEKIDKETFKGFFKMAFEGNEDFKIEMASSPNLKFNISEIHVTSNDGKYAFISYPISMKMTFLKEKIDDEKKEMMKNMMEVQGMKVKFLDDQSLVMDKLSLTVAIKDKDTNNAWKYLNHDESSPYYIDLVSSEIVKKAKDHYSNLLIKEKENGN